MMKTLRAKIKNLPPEHQRQILVNYPKLPEREKTALLALVEEIAARQRRKVAQGGLLDFITAVYPGYKVGAHHRRLAKLLEDAIHGDKKRIIVNIAPRMGKSELVSYLFPAWFLGHHPDKKIIMATHTADLSVNFGRRVRDLVNSDDYKAVFPAVSLNPDAKAAGQWNTSAGGQYYAAGVGGALAGRGADVFVIDDPHSEQDAKSGNPAAFLPAWEWFQSGPLQRLMPDGVIIVVMTRWSMLDLTGQLTNHMIKNPDADQWEVVEFPAILDENTPEERSLWPEFWPLEELKKKRAGMDTRYWSSQYLQNPTAEGAQLIKKEWWKHWDKDDPPQCDYTIMSLDAAQESHNRADYNAVTNWGVFFNEETNQNNIILLNAWKERMEFPQLKKAMIREYTEWEPDTFIVEKKSSGAALYQELRSMGMPVSEFTPSRGNDKISRVNSITDLFASGIIWAPTDRRWASEVMQECADFPVGTHDDYVDSVTQALIRFRKGGFIKLPSDEKDDEVLYQYARKAAYY